MLTVTHVVGARPNFMKAAPVILALQRIEGVQQQIVHTGQHYDANMSDVFFRQLGIPQPDINLEVGSGSHAAQTAQIMTRFEEVVLRKRPDWVVVYGDVNSTVAAALVCAKLGIRVAHVEAGLRSFDHTMPEEINRLVTDRLANLLLTPSADGDENLAREGVDPERVVMVGNCMIDTVVRLLPEARRPAIDGLEPPYALVTLHRPSNVDDPAQLARLMEAMEEIGRRLTVVFPVHPRTRARLNSRTVSGKSNALLLVEPQGYLEFLALQRDATVVVTDSGGMQEETTFLGVPCLTMRENTERPVTCTIGTNKLLGRDCGRLVREVQSILDGNRPAGRIPPLWDGKSGGRVAELLVSRPQ